MRKKLSIILVTFIVLTLGIAFLTQKKPYVRSKTYDNPDKLIEEFFKSWNYELISQGGGSTKEYPKGHRDCLSDKLNTTLSMEHFVTLPDSSSFKAKLLEYKDITNDKKLNEHLNNYGKDKDELLGLEYPKPDDFKFYKVKYTGINLHEYGTPEYEVKRIYILIKKNGHWYIDNFGQEYVLRGVSDN